MTERLYYKSAYLKEFDARVISCSRAEGCWQIILDSTAFYPEGGGQPADTGVIYSKPSENAAAGGNSSTGSIPKAENHIADNNTADKLLKDKDKDRDKDNAAACSSSELSDIQSESAETDHRPVHVFDVQEKDGAVIHFCDLPLEPGAKVHGRIDWERRFDHMQQHSGEHIVSGMICEAFECDNVGFHMGKELVTIDYNANISLEALKPIEDRANAYINERHAFKAAWYDSDELGSLEYRSKKHIDGKVRITSFPGADTCACCGTHVENSIEVGMVKFISAQSFTKGTRIELVCGQRAFRLLSLSHEQNAAIAKAMATGIDKTYAIYMKQRRELNEAALRAAELERLYCTEKAAGFSCTAAQADADAKAYVDAKTYVGAGTDTGAILLFEPILSQAGIRVLSQLTAEAAGRLCAVFSGSENSYRYALFMPDMDKQACTALVKAMNDALNGRGGGSGGLAQGSVCADETTIRDYFDQNLNGRKTDHI